MRHKQAALREGGLRAAKLVRCVQAMCGAQASLAEQLAEMSSDREDGSEHLACHARVQDLMGKNALGVAEGLHFFAKEMGRFIQEDLGAVHKLVAAYEGARLAYDEARGAYESLKATQSPKLPAVESRFLEAYNAMSDRRRALWAALCEAEEAENSMLKTQVSALGNAMQIFLTGSQAGFDAAMSTLEQSGETCPPTPSAPSAVASEGELDASFADVTLGDLSDAAPEDGAAAEDGDGAELLLSV